MRTTAAIVALTGALLALAPPTGVALEVEGVQIAEQATLADGTALALNGAGVRVKFIVDVYVGALYLPARMGDAEAVLAEPRANRVLMHFVYDKVDAQSLREAWSDGFEANHTQAELAGLRERIDRFNALFTDAVEGDEYTLDFSPGAGTVVARNGQPLGTIDGDDFNRALLAIWLGERPADKRLKKAMLGG